MNDVVIWEVETEDGKQHELYWERKYLHTSFKGLGFELSPKMAAYFNDKMIGKEMMVDLGGAGPIPKEK